jgi:predicted permease
MVFVESLWQDLRFGIRMLVKHPGVASIAVTALALGLGLTTTMFSIIEGAILKGLPFPEAERLVVVERTNLTQGQNRSNVPVSDYTDWKERQHSFEDLAAYYNGTVNLSGKDGGPERISGAFITPNLFNVIRQQPIMGRALTQEENDPNGPQAVVLGYGVWKRRYAGDPNILGKTIRVNGRDMSIVGVMPANFMFPFREEVWIPLRMDPLKLGRNNGNWLTVLGRLNRGVSQDQALLEYAGIARQLAAQYPESNKDIGVRMESLVDQAIGPEPRALLYTMLGAVFGVLLIACSNVANLLLARAAARSREVAIRTALGAGRWRVVSQLLMETLVLAGVGGVLGLGIAQLGTMWFSRAIIQGNPPYWINIHVDGVVLAFVASVTLLSAIIAGIVPALQVSAGNVSEALKDEARGSSSLRMGKFSRTLVIAEIALSCGLLIGAGLMTKSVITLKTFDYGFATDNVFTARIGLFETNYPDSLKRQQFWTVLLDRFRAEPGVRAASYTTRLPALGSGQNNIAIEGKAYAADRDYPSARNDVITPDFFKTFNVPILHGRDFQLADAGGSIPVAVVNQSFARRFTPPGGSVIGLRFRPGDSRSKQPWITVVGLVPDMHMAGTDSTTLQGYYTPLAQSDQRFVSVAARVDGDPLAFGSVLRRTLAGIDPDQPIYFVRTETGAIEQNTWFYGVFGTLFMVFGAVALVLASVGLYGVMAFAVSRRTQEVGVRMALGAGRGDVLQMFLRQGAIQLVIGVSIGLVLAFFLAKGLRIMLFHVNTFDPVMFVAISAMLIVVGLIACFIPARRATRVDPLVALRYE